MTNDRSRRVILLIDYDNLQICASRDAPGTELDLHAVLERAQSYGTVVVARAYAEWNMPSERLGVYKAGIEPVFAPVLRTESRGRVEGKSLCDTVMVVEGVDLLWTMHPEVLVLVTSDKDLIPLARVARQRGAWVVVIGSDLTAVQLVEMCNELVTYKQLLKEQGKGTEPTPAPPPPPRTRADRGRLALPPSRPPRQREPVAALPTADVGDEGDIKTVEEIVEVASGVDEGPDGTPARRRRRRRGRTRADESAGTGVDASLEAAAAGEGDGNGYLPAAVDELAPVERVDAPVADGLVAATDLATPEANESAEAEAPARPPRRRRRPTASHASSESSAEPSPST